MGAFLKAPLHCFFHFQLNGIGNHGYELAVCGFSLVGVDGIAENVCQYFLAAAVPCHFNSVADSAFHSGGGGAEVFCHGGI